MVSDWETYRGERILADRVRKMAARIEELERRVAELEGTIGRALGRSYSGQGENDE